MEEVVLIAIGHKVLHSKVCSFPIHFLWDFPEGATFAILLMATFIWLTLQILE